MKPKSLHLFHLHLIQVFCFLQSAKLDFLANVTFNSLPNSLSNISYIVFFFYMGCAPTKPLMDLSHQGLHKLKMENGYVKGARKSSSGGRNLRGSSGGGSSSGGRGGGSDGGSGVVRRSSVSGKSDDMDELVDGWPKWLTDNVPKDALDGLVPKSAEAFDKLDKVSTLSVFRLIVT